jgi:hypothetical protein
VNNHNGGVAIGEAAHSIGISIDAVRQRIKRGQLTGYKENGRWFVYLNRNGQAPEPTPEQPSSPDQSTVISALVDQLRVKDEQIAAKDRQIERDAEERAELRRLLGNAQMQLTQLLPAPKDESLTRNDVEADQMRPRDVSEPVEPSQDLEQRRPWWKWWG